MSVRFLSQVHPAFTTNYCIHLLWFLISTLKLIVLAINIRPYSFWLPSLIFCRYKEPSACPFLSRQSLNIHVNHNMHRTTWIGYKLGTGVISIYIECRRDMYNIERIFVWRAFSGIGHHLPFVLRCGQFLSWAYVTFLMAPTCHAMRGSDVDRLLTTVRSCLGCSYAHQGAPMCSPRNFSNVSFGFKPVWFPTQ